MTIHFKRIFILLMLMFVNVLTVHAETRCNVIGSTDRFFLVDVNGEKFNAMSKSIFEELKHRSEADAEVIEKLKNQLAQYRKTVGEYRELTTRYEELRQDQQTLTDDYNRSLSASVSLNQAYQNKSNELLQLTASYDKLARDYDALAGKFRGIAVDSTSLFKLDVGAGVTSNNGDAVGAVLIGVGFQKIKAWGFMQRDNSGLLVGTSYRF